MALPKVNRRLNIVIDVETDDGRTIHIHSTPVRRAIFEAHARLIARAFSTMYTENINGPFAARVALPMLIETAKDMGREDQLNNQLLPEIWRLTNALIPGQQGYETVPFHDVMAQKLIDEDAMEEVKSAIVFFTLTSWVHSKTELATLIYPLAESLGLHTVSLDCTDYRTSLPTSMPAESTGPRETASSIPS